MQCLVVLFPCLYHVCINSDLYGCFTISSVTVCSVASLMEYSRSC